MFSRLAPVLCFALLPLLATAGPDAGLAGKRVAGEGDRELTAGQYRLGLNTLRRYLEKRGEDSAAAERFILNMERAFPGADSERVPVTKDVFAAFLRYQAAWARKTRDSKNPNVTAIQLEQERLRATRLKEIFRLEASVKSPRFYSAFQASVQDLRQASRRYGKKYAGDSAVFFGDQIDDSYTHVDAGDVALESGDTAKAIEEADRALQVNPSNADAYVLRAGAEYDRQDLNAAVRDAKSALRLDPGNLQARAILSLSGSDAAQAAAKSAVAGSSSLAGDGRSAALSRAGSIEDRPEAVSVPATLRLARGTAAPSRSLIGFEPPPPGEREAPPPSATPAVGALLSRDMTSNAVRSARADARASIEQLDQALLLNPRNDSARSWRATLANRIGDYTSALASAQQSLTGDPDDAGAYFNKAYALAGKGDKEGTLEALAQAVRIDPSYGKVLDDARLLPGPEDMALLLSDSAPRHLPAAPPSRSARFPLPLLILCGAGALLAVASVAQLFRGSGPSSRWPMNA